MVNSQEIIERSIYKAILTTAIDLSYTLDPNSYLPKTEENVRRMQEDKKNLSKFIFIYGTGNAPSKDQKITPRIVINAKGFYPGSIGLPKYLQDKEEVHGSTRFNIDMEPYETIDQYVDIHLVAQNQEDLRLLHQILFWSIPQRGYIKPYTSKKLLTSGNIFIELGNFFDYSNINLGILEKVYQFKIYDTLVGEVEDIQNGLVPINSIDVFLTEYKEYLLNINSK